MMSYAGIPVTSLIFGVAGVAGFFLFVAILKSIIKVQLPNKLIVVTGRKSRVGGKSYGFSVTSGRTSVVPYLQAAETLDLEILPINVRVEGVNSANGINVGADATACVCIDNDDEGMVYSAVERLMGKNSDQIKDQIQQTLIGNLRGALNKATPLKAIGMEDEVLEADTASAIEESDRAQFRAELVEDINSDLSAFGMKVVSVSFQRIWDDSNYFANLAKKTLSEKRREVEIQEAQLRAEAERAESNATKLAEVAKSEADRKIVAAREALEVYRKESAALIERTRLEAEGGFQLRKTQARLRSLR
jgi:flotillin